MDAQRPGQKEVTKEAHHASEMRMCRHMQSQLNSATEPSLCRMTSVSYVVTSRVNFLHRKASSQESQPGQSVGRHV